jgi:cell division protein FtsB
MPGRGPTSRPAAGPGRGRTRTRPHSRPPVADAAPTGPAPDPAATPAPGPTVGRPAGPRFRSNVTGRAIALAVVLLILVISYASSLRVYFAQSQEIAAARAEIAERQQRIADLTQQREQWNNPAYVETQARDRLGWVVPGEIGYRVVGADGKPLGGGEDIDTGAGAAPEPTTAWWTRLWSSVERADRPAPPTSSVKAKPPTVTERTVPSPAASGPR